MPTSHSPSWLSVIALAFAAFIFNTTEYLPIALLTDIGKSFQLSSTEAGIMLTVYAWVVALMSLPLMLLTRNMERRSLLMWLFALFIGGHLIAFSAWNFPVLLASRVLIALSHAVFWSITAALAMRLAPPGAGNRALSLLSIGTVSAMLLGIPLGRVIGNFLGWRVSMLLIGAAALVVSLILAKNLPKLPSVNSGSFSSIPVLFKRKNLLLMFAFTVTIVTAHFTAYTYIEPFVLQVGGFSAEQVTLLLMFYGLAGFIGSYLFGKWFDGYSKGFFIGFCLLMVASMLLLYPLLESVWAAYILCLLWGIAYSAIGLAMISRVLHFASDATDVATSIYSGLYNVGIGSGALLGHYAGVYLGLKNLSFLGAAMTAIAALIAWILIRQPGFNNRENQQQAVH
ncbi:MAG: sugar transporter [Neisseria sp.]|uniref:sugar transporter n=1 Tax=Neisseria sp. TaxID=192066 RepID=UPI0026DAC049|nr:sugar transporter [Neisseria sp.]MDO4249623.1 sugar transporter [Neisseria sp.]